MARLSRSEEDNVPDFRLMFPNDYLGAHEFRGKDVTKVIKSVSMEDLRVEGGKKERRPVLTFEDTPKKLVLNKTNAKTIAKLHGNDTATWIKRAITMFPTTCMFGRERVDCIRIRSNVQAGRIPVDEHPLDIEDGEEAVDDMDPEPSLGGDA